MSQWANRWRYITIFKGGGGGGGFYSRGRSTNNFDEEEWNGGEGGKEFSQRGWWKMVFMTPKGWGRPYKVRNSQENEWCYNTAAHLMVRWPSHFCKTNNRPKKNKIGDIKHVKKDTAIYHVCCYGFSQGWENRSLYDKCLKCASQLSCFWYLSNFIWQYLERYRTYHDVLDYILLPIFFACFCFHRSTAAFEPCF